MIHPNMATMLGFITTDVNIDNKALQAAFKANIDDSLMLISRSVIEPIQDLKVNSLRHRNPRLHLDEVLIALAISANTNPVAELALKQLPKLNNLQAHSSVILSETDLNCLKKLGIQVTEESVLKYKKLY